jgi:glucosyl-dolichyl phosphate glucuronosyltransferase
MSKAMVCIGMPVYNGGTYLAKAFEALLNQTYSSFRVVVLDDGSSDESVQIIEKYLKQDDRISFQSNPSNQGLISAWRRVAQIGLQEFCPKWFAWYSDHDWVSIDWLSNLVQMAESSTNLILGYGRTMHVLGNGDNFHVVGECRQIDTTEMTSHERIKHLALMPSGAGDMVYGLFNAACLQRCGVFPNELLPDRLLVGAMGILGNIKCVPGAIRFRRVNPEHESYKNPMAKQMETLFNFQNHPQFPYLSHITFYFRELTGKQLGSNSNEEASRLLYLALLHYQRQLNNYRYECVQELKRLQEHSEAEAKMPFADFVRATLDHKWRILYQDYAGLLLKLKAAKANLRKAEKRISKLAKENEWYRTSCNEKTRLGNAEQSTFKNDKALSIIICTFNREALLRLCLMALVPQIEKLTSDEVEVIVVQNNCTDNTAGLIREYESRYPWFRGVQESRQGLSYARNRGVSESQGRYLCFLDDDGMPNDQYVKNVLEVIRQHTPDIFGGPIYPYYTSSKPHWFKDELEIRKNAASTGFHDCRISGGNFIIQSELLKALGMFSSHFGMIGNKVRLGEERAVLEKYREQNPPPNRRIFYSLESFIYHHVPTAKMRFGYIIKRGFASGKSAVLVKREHSKNFPQQIMRVVREACWELPRMILKDVLEGRDVVPPLVFKLREMAILSGKIYQHSCNYFSERKSSCG